MTFLLRCTPRRTAHSAVLRAVSFFVEVCTQEGWQAVSFCRGLHAGRQAVLFICCIGAVYILLRSE